uniref:Uncharacterized protein n=1 Tax=Myoviridae sp. ctcyQ27 TaxID=2825139 RepID=A0A8S5UF39_9CAUD|nr:MAG TPA: hypothetical protein [Myoviridae sp. ctcyQ27]
MFVFALIYNFISQVSNVRYLWFSFLKHYSKI